MDVGLEEPTHAVGSVEVTEVGGSLVAQAHVVEQLKEDLRSNPSRHRASSWSCTFKCAKGSWEWNDKRLLALRSKRSRQHCKGRLLQEIVGTTENKRARLEAIECDGVVADTKRKWAVDSGHHARNLDPDDTEWADQIIF